MKAHNFKFKTMTLVSLITAYTLMPNAMAAPGVISEEPLQTSASAPSNVMFTLDSSGSMDIISPEPFTHTYTCTTPLADTKTIDLTITANKPRIENVTDSVTRDLGNTGTTYCFDPAKTYTARLNTLSGGYGYVPYKGDYLNWYFDISTDIPLGTSWTNYKPGAKTRMEIAQTSLTGLVDTLKNINVGYSKFNSGSGANIVVDIADITSTQKTTIKNAITATSANGVTPLAETLRDIGRYFANGDGTNGSTSGACGGATGTNLTIHPDDALTTATPAGLKEDVSCGDTSSGLLYASTSTIRDKAGPIKYFCQKNFAVMLTDGFPTSDTTVHSHFHDYDQDCTVAAQTAGSYTCGTADTKSTDPGPASDYWDDVAQALYEIDLRPDLNDQQGNAYKNNLATYTIGFSDVQIKNLQLIKDVATQGGGENYYAANSSELSTALADIQANIDSQSGTAAAVTFNSSTLSSQSAVYQALFNTQRWSGQLHSIPLDGFTGDILTASCTAEVAAAGTLNNCWWAEKRLDAQGTSRTILTFNPVSNQGVDFAFVAPATASIADYTNLISEGSSTTSSKIPLTLVDDLCASHDIPFPCNASTALDSAKIDANFKYMADLVNYLKGDRTHEAIGSTGADGNSRDFRIRTHVLGDIVNSSPVYVGKPQLGWPNKAPFPVPPVAPATTPDNTYNTWASSAIKNRMPVVYVAANDGMVHGFRTEQTDSAAPSNDAGDEVFAYIPTATFGKTNTSGLHYLANPDYQHQFYVDLNPTLSDVYIKHRKGTTGTVTTDPEWRTVLVGGQGAGGNSMFMLDVTDPSDFTTANAKQLVEWEFNHPNLGRTYSKPTIAMMNNGRFAAIFGNGYNSMDNLPTAGDCKAKLFIVYLDGGMDGTWTAGTDYLEIDTAAGTTADCNGLSTPAVVDLNGDSVADRVYAGDLHGNLWAFDLCDWQSGTSVCSTATTNWGVADKTNGEPIMTTNDDASPNKRQPITVKPVVSRDPATTGTDNLIIVFGTGQYITSADITDTQQQTFYGLRDYDAISNGRATKDYGLNPRADKFVTQTITEAACTLTGCIGDVRTVSNTSLNSTSNGWLIDLPASRERLVVNPKIRNNILFFNTVIPDDRKCYAGGDGWLMSVNLDNGGIPLVPVFDLNLDGIIDGLDQEGGVNPVGTKVFAIPAESTFLGDNQYTPDSAGNIQKRQVNIGKNQREGRMSWKELYEDN